MYRLKIILPDWIELEMWDFDKYLKWMDQLIKDWKKTYRAFNIGFD